LKKAVVKACADEHSKETERPKPTSGAWLSRANFLNRSRWARLYAGPYVEYSLFIEGHIAALMQRPASDNWTAFPPSEMRRHYLAKYVTHKCIQVEKVLKKGDSLCIDIKEELTRQM